MTILFHKNYYMDSLAMWLATPVMARESISLFYKNHLKLVLSNSGGFAGRGEGAVMTPKKLITTAITGL